MMKKPFYAIGILLVLLIFCACSPSLSPEEDVLDFYTEYVEACKADRVDAAMKYVHFEDPSDLEREEQNANCTLLRTDVLSIEKLSDDLWALRIYYENLYIPDGNTTYHFVGTIDGEYKVMKHSEDIPTALSQDLNLDQYQPTGDYISPGDVMEEDDQI